MTRFVCVLMGMLLVASAALAQAGQGQIGPGEMGFVVTAGTLGVGGDVGFRIKENGNFRAGGNFFRFSHDYAKDGINYAGHLKLQSVHAQYDYYPFSGSFHVSPGLLMYNGNRLDADASVPGGKTFTLGGVTYLSDTTDPVHGNGTMSGHRVAPLLLAGFGNVVPGLHHFTFLFEAGGAYHGTPDIKLNLAGTVCQPGGFYCSKVATDPNVQANLKAEVAKMKNNVKGYTWFPIVQFGLVFRM